jgi:ketosteroid isomerase-like protein
LRSPEATVRAWIDAFNGLGHGGDLETVLELYDEAIRTESPLLLKLGKDGSVCIEGKPALREYFGRALARAETPPVFTPLHLLEDGEVVILEYNREAVAGSSGGGQPGVAERFVVRNGKIVESRVFWSAEKIRDSFVSPAEGKTSQDG